MSKAKSYTIMGLFFAGLCLVVFFGIGVLVNLPEKPIPVVTPAAACQTLRAETCEFLVGCEIFKGKQDCVQAMNNDKFCDHDIRSSVKDIQQCTAEMQAMDSCMAGLPTSCWNLE